MYALCFFLLLGLGDLKEEGNKGYSQYIELMEHRRNPHYGKTKCFGCLLNPDPEDSALFIGINKVITRFLVEDKESNSKKDYNYNNTTSTTTSTLASIYPCKVLNR